MAQKPIIQGAANRRNKKKPPAKPQLPWARPRTKPKANPSANPMAQYARPKADKPFIELSPSSVLDAAKGAAGFVVSPVIGAASTVLTVANEGRKDANRRYGPSRMVRVQGPGGGVVTVPWTGDGDPPSGTVAWGAANADLRTKALREARGAQSGIAKKNNFFKPKPAKPAGKGGGGNGSGNQGGEPGRPTPPGFVAPPAFNVPKPNYAPIPKWQDLAEDKGFDDKINEVYGPALRRLDSMQAAAKAASQAQREEYDRYAQWLAGENTAREGRVAEASQKATDQMNEGLKAIGAASQANDAKMAAITGNSEGAKAAAGLDATQANSQLATQSLGKDIEGVELNTKLAQMDARAQSRQNEARVGDLRKQAHSDYLKIVGDLADLGIQLNREKAQALYNEAVRRVESNRNIKLQNYQGRSSYAQAQNARQDSLMNWAVQKFNADTSRANSINATRQQNFTNQANLYEVDATTATGLAKAGGNGSGGAASSLTNSEKHGENASKAIVGSLAKTDQDQQHFIENPQDAVKILQPQLAVWATQFRYADPMDIYRSIAATYGQAAAKRLKKRIFNLFNKAG